MKIAYIGIIATLGIVNVLYSLAILRASNELQELEAESHAQMQTVSELRSQ